MQNSFLDGILGAVSSPGSSGTGSGTLNFLTGLNSSTATGSGASGITGLLSTLGPIGSGVGMVANLIPGLDGFLENGFDFTCLGGQAYGKNNLNQQLNDLKLTSEKYQNGQITKPEFLNWLHGTGVDSRKEISRYKSGCSKSLRTKFLEATDGVYNSIDKSDIRTVSGTRQDWKGETVEKVEHFLKEGFQAGSGSNILPTITVEQFNREYVPQIQAYALQNGLDQNEAIKTAYDKLFPGSGGWGGSGGVTVNEDGSIDWNVEAGNNRNNTITYVLLAGAALFAWKMLKK